MSKYRLKFGNILSQTIALSIQNKSPQIIEECLKNPKKVEELGLNPFEIASLIIATGKSEEYLTLENYKKLGLHFLDIPALIESTGNIEKYLLPGQDINDELLDRL